MAKEIIKQIVDFPDYYVSDKGKFYTTRISKRYNMNGDMHELKTRKHPSGYLYVGFYPLSKSGNKNRKWRRAHRVVAVTFLGKIPKGKEVNHKDMDKHNNKVTNLEYMTRSENHIHWRTKKNKLAKTK
jgi:hypothetical protein